MLLNYDYFNKINEYSRKVYTDLDIDIFKEEIKNIKEIIEDKEIKSIDELMKKSNVSRNKILSLIKTDILNKNKNNNFIANFKRKYPSKDSIKKAIRKYKEINKEKEEMKQTKRKQDIELLLNKIYKKIKLKGFKYIEPEQIYKILNSEDLKGKFDYKYIDFITDYTPLEKEIITVSDKESDINKMKDILVYRWRKDKPEPNDKMVDDLYKKAYYSKESEIDKMRRMEEEKDILAKITKANKKMSKAAKKIN